MHKILKEERDQGLDGRTVLKECLDIIANPYVITQTAEDIPKEYKKQVIGLMTDLSVNDNEIYAANDYLDYEYILPNYNLFFASIDEGNEITIFQDQTSSLYNSINYSFSVEELENNNVTDKYSNEIVELTENFTEKYYMAGYGLPATYFKINIKEKDVVKNSINFSSNTIETMSYNKSFTVILSVV